MLLLVSLPNDLLEATIEREVKTMRYRGWVIGALLAVAATTSALAADMTPRQVADAYMAAWNAHDPEAAAALMADDVTYLDATVGEPQKGREAARDKVCL